MSAIQKGESVYAAFLKTLSRLNPAVCKIHLFPYRIRHERNSLATDNITQLDVSAIQKGESVYGAKTQLYDSVLTPAQISELHMDGSIV